MVDSTINTLQTTSSTIKTNGLWITNKVFTVLASPTANNKYKRKISVIFTAVLKINLLFLKFVVILIVVNNYLMEYMLYYYLSRSEVTNKLRIMEIKQTIMENMVYLNTVYIIIFSKLFIHHSIKAQANIILV